MYYTLQHTFSTPVKSFSISSNELIDMPAFKCQCMPYKEAAMLDAAVVLAEYIEKLCSVNRKRNKALISFDNISVFVCVFSMNTLKKTLCKACI